MLTLSLLGVPQIRRAEEPVDMPRQQPLALLAYLALAAEPVSRERLAFLLWADAPQRQANQRLRRVLSYLRCTLNASPGDDYLTGSTTTIALDRDRCWIDSLMFERLVEEDSNFNGRQALARAEEALALYRGPLLDGFTLANAPEFEQWLLLERERLAARYRGLLARLVAGYRAAGRTLRALRAAQRLLEADPLCEATHATLMNLYLEAGQRTRAIEQYHSCESLLRTEFGIAPLPATRALYERLTRPPRPLPTHPTPAPAWQLHPTLNTRLVGRDAQLGAVRQHVQRALDGCPLVVALSGPPASGKTRVLQEALAILPVPVWLENGRGASQGVPFAAALGLLQTALRSHAGELPQAGGWQADLARVQPGTGERPAIDARLFAPLTRLMGGLVQAVGGAVLVLDDLDRVDRLSVAWLAHFVAEAARQRLPLALVLAYPHAERVPALERWSDELARQGMWHELALHGLTRLEVVALLEATPLPAAGHVPLAARLYRQVGGNPFFLLETVRVLLDRPMTGGVLRAPLPRPASIQRVAATCMRGLAPMARRLLEACAVLRAPLNVAALGRVLRQKDDEVALALHEVLQQGLLKRTAGGFSVASGALAHAVRSQVGAEWRAIIERRAALDPLLFPGSLGARAPELVPAYTPPYGEGA